MRSHIRLGKVFGIEIGLHYSWLIIAALIAYSLAAHFRAVNSAWSPGLVWTVAIITAVLFFAGLITHELAHSLVARARNIPVKRITLFALGGMAQIEKEATDARTEFWIAIVGPITSVVLGFMLLALALAAGWTPRSEPVTAVTAVLVWLGYINITLGVFNMVPGFPLDGGRVLRAIVWWISGSAEKAMRVAVTSGRVIGVAMIFYGLFRGFTGGGFGGLWLAFIGWFLYEAAGATYLQFEMSSLLTDLRARDLMSRDCAEIDGGISVQSFVEDLLLRTPQRCFVVNDGGRMAGIVTFQEAKSTDRSLWPQTPVRAIMRPIDKVRAVAPDTPVSKAMELMAREDLNQVPVISGQHFEGMISRANILRVLQSREELKAS